MVNVLTDLRRSGRAQGSGREQKRFVSQPFLRSPAMRAGEHRNACVSPPPAASDAACLTLNRLRCRGLTLICRKRRFSELSGWDSASVLLQLTSLAYTGRFQQAPSGSTDSDVTTVCVDFLVSMVEVETCTTLAYGCRLGGRVFPPLLGYTGCCDTSNFKWKLASRLGMLLARELVSPLNSILPLASTLKRYESHTAPLRSQSADGFSKPVSRSARVTFYAPLGE
jgi:hypothetical protein